MRDGMKVWGTATPAEKEFFAKAPEVQPPPKSPTDGQSKADGFWSSASKAVMVVVILVLGFLICRDLFHYATSEEAF